MAMTLRLSESQSAALRKSADEQGISMQEAALAAIDQYLSKRDARFKNIIQKIAIEDKELLDRLAQ